MMKRKGPPLWLCLLLLFLALGWRMIGAPLTGEEFSQAKTPLWQARILLPSRVQRVLRLWQPSEKTSAPQTLTEDAMDDEQRSRQGDQTVLNVYLAQEEMIQPMTLSGYVCGVVAAEMPASYHMEALKAQAVAARTRVWKQKQQGGCSLHPGADICTDSAHCQGYATLKQCRQQWGSAYESYRDRILLAEGETQNQLITYEGEPITVLYHAISGGRTEDAQAVFSQPVPYLVSVHSDGEEQTRGFTQEITLSFAEIAQRLTDAGWPLSADEVRRTLSVDAYTQTGRVASMQAGGYRISGRDFRKALSLRSMWFSMRTDAENVTFVQRGYGHGVGMSQAGANSMAAEGADYAAILTHYYPGVEISPLE